MSSGSSFISYSPSSSLDSCCSLIISASSRVPLTVMSSSAAMYSPYVQSGANLCHVSSSRGRFKFRGQMKVLLIGQAAVPWRGLAGRPDWNLNPDLPVISRPLAEQLDTVSHFPLDIGEGRSLSNVLKRISNLVALKNTGLQSYKNTDFKQYWMPDSVSKECYDCGEKFTTFRRRHHCRVCGQIFCSRCCNQEIPGKIMGCTGYTNRCLADIELGLGHDQMSEKVTFCTVGTTLFPFRRVVDGISPGDLRVCTYCCKIVLSYLQSADVGADLTADLRAVQEDLQIKFGNPVSSLAQNNTSSSGGNLSDNQDSSSVRRKTSVGYQEDRFALGRAQSAAYLSMEERCRVLQMSASLRALFDDLCRPNLGLILQTHRYRLRNYHNCFLGTELVDWLIAQYHASTRVNPMDLPDEISEEVIELQNNSNFRDSFESSVNMEEFEQGTAIGQALLVAGYLESITMSEQSFNDGYSLYRPLLDLSPTQPTLSSSDLEESRRSSQDAQEPLWVKQIPQDDFSTKDSESEGVSMEREDSSSLPSSGSMFYLDLNVEANTAHLIRPNKAADNEIDSASGAGSKQTEITGNAGVSSPLQDNSHSGISSEFLSGAVLSQSREMRPSKGWHKVSQLRTDNGELGAYNALCNAFTQHESSLLKQLLNAEGLAQSWADIMLPLAEQIVDVVCPDVKNEVDDMDIRQYVQFKKVPGGSRESRIVSGVVCTKNVAHRAMATRLVNPRILLLGCSIAYQRVEGKLLSLEPVMMQEYEYLRNVVARIAKLQPNLVLVQRNVSRLAQEFLLGLQVTLVLNIKASVLERVSRCTQADIVTSVDAHIGRPRLGTCQMFHLETFNTERGASKTLMFFEGCISPHLGCTVLLRGASNTELAKLKRVATRMIFIEYSWRLEKSFLMDESARPPSPPSDTFFEDHVSNDAANNLDQHSNILPFTPVKTETILNSCSNADLICHSVSKGFSDCIHTSSPSLGLLDCIQTISTSSPCTKEGNVPLKCDSSKTFGSDVQKCLFFDSLSFERKEESINGPINISNIDQQLNSPTSPRDCCIVTSDISNKDVTNSLSDLHTINLNVSHCSCKEPFPLEDDNLVNSTHYCKNLSSVGENSSIQRFDLSYPCNNSSTNLEKTLKCTCNIIDIGNIKDNGETQCQQQEEICKCKIIKFQTSSKDKSSLSEEKRMNVESVSDFSDPLHLYLSLDDDVFSTGQQNGQQLSVAELPLSNHFRKALDDTILSASPFLKFTVPYLETEAGRNCALRRFFPDEIFWSAQFNSSSDTNTNSRANNGMEMAMQPDNKLLPRHEFVSAKITSSADSKEVQTLLAHFRACGSRLCPSEPCTESPLLKGSTEQPGKLQATPWPDALDLARHQRLAVLFCSYSQESSNFPAFCVNPWIFYMDFYGHYDIPLGSFLERYCFSKSYMCPSTSCDTPMMHHIRRFVHNSGCVYLMLKELDSNLIDSADDKHILMWNWCSKCKSGTPLVEMSEDTWALSFAKYLELRFHGHMYTRREHDNTCNHSLHHDHFQYFSMKNIVVSFKYTSVVVWEASLPPPVIILKYDPQHQNNIIDDLKKLALKGYEVYSGILDKLCSLETDLEGLSTMKQQLQKEQNNLKTCIDEVQLQLTSPTLESKKLQGVDGEQDVQLLMWRIEDSVVHLKQLIAEGFTSWNSRIQDIAIHSKKKNNDNMKPVSLNTSLPETEGSITRLLEDDTSSCSEGRESPLTSGEGVGVTVIVDSEEATDIEDTLGETQNKMTDSTDAVEEVCVGQLQGSPRGHVRTPSDVSAAQEEKQSHPNTDKKSVKTILSQLLPSTSGTAALQSSLSPQEHHLSSLGCTVPIVVYENEPSSIIAYALSSPDYHCNLDDAIAKQHSFGEPPSASPSHKRKSGQSQTEQESGVESTDSRRTGVLSFLRGTAANGVNLGRMDGVQYSTTATFGETAHQGADSDDNKPSKTQPSLHIEVQFSDTTSKFFCIVYYAEQFAAIRKMVLPSGEEGFVRSLARCVQWAARGGKSGSSFCKTKDDRFILKEMSKLEKELFLEFAPNYFSYVQHCHTSNQPTLLGKIVGVYRVVYRNMTSNATLRSQLLVMENLFYGRSVTHKFDLKGSVRNRLVNPTGQQGEIVLLDENLLKMTCNSPLYILPHSKTVLTQAIDHDTKFLASQKVIDYSLLVGLDQDRRELVVGIIDYIRTFTWDKKLETMVKSSGILGGQGKQPTVVSPEIYQARFIAAMHKYFLPVPDHWTGLARGFDC
uniref:1-phosphatidylinositol-3-phosphate 5-kinase n=1 Tax=Timema douglasi TaxID=61478 RepID=A0A7R8VBK5_TIMDO|nr:unnamed protein product [Timema douglasi]